MNGERFETIAMQSARDLLVYPLRAWGSIIHGLFKCPATSPEILVNSFYFNEKLHEVTCDDMMKALRETATSIGKDTLCFKLNDIGTHSIRSGSSIGIYLAEVPVYTILLIGRWSSDPFIRYIRMQVEQFSHTVIRRMMQHRHFTHVPNLLP